MLHTVLPPDSGSARSGSAAVRSLTGGVSPLSPALDPETANHCRRVSWYASGFAERLGMDDREVEVIRLGALMHDVGKATLPGSLIEKPGALTTDEWARLREHAGTGERIAADLGLPNEVQAIVRHHHERWDGAGYPDGLAGEAIPRSARIVCIVDTYDAILTDRSYQPARTTREALKVMEAQAAGLFDPELLDAFFLLMAPRSLGLGSAAA
jgi:putative nucleotidyltransferase with HDIG domain